MLFRSSYFKSGNSYSPVPIDFKLDLNGAFVRQCLNFRLGDYTQRVPFYLWDKGGEGFGSYGGNSDGQQWDKTKIASLPLQRLFSISGSTSPGTNYAFPDGEEEYLLKPTIYQSGFHGRNFKRFANFSTSSIKRMNVYNHWNETYVQIELENLANNILIEKKFLTNDDYQVAMFNGDELAIFHTTSYSGLEGFIEDLIADYDPKEINEEDANYIIEQAEAEGVKELPSAWYAFGLYKKHKEALTA